MTMRCPVILNNDAVTVFRFGGVDVQVTSIKRPATYVNVLYENGKYTIVADDYKENKAVKVFEPVETISDNETAAKPNYRRNKKTTVDSANEEDGANITSED